MRIDDFLPEYDATERHARTYAAQPGEVWKALHAVDFARPFAVRVLFAIRLLPALLAGKAPGRPREPLTIDRLVGSGFGVLASEPPRELVLGVEGRFWRPTGNVDPFDRARFERPVAAGRARGIWNFALATVPGGTRVTTETRVACGDAASRRKFRLYWLLVRPGSGLLRHVLLAAVAKELRRGPRGSA